MTSSLNLLETFGIAASTVLGVGMVACAAVIVVRIAFSIARSSARDVRPARSAVATRRTRKERSRNVYGDMVRAVLESQAAETDLAAAPSAAEANDPLPVFAKAERRLEIADAGVASAA